MNFLNEMVPAFHTEYLIIDAVSRGVKLKIDRSFKDQGFLPLYLLCCKIQRWAAGWMMIGVRVPAGAGNFSLHHHVHTGSEAHPASYPGDTRALSFGVKRPGVKLNEHSPPSSAQVKECVDLSLHSPVPLNGVVLSKRKSTRTTLP
jgi:hypothetical protein